MNTFHRSLIHFINFGWNRIKVQRKIIEILPGPFFYSTSGWAMIFFCGEERQSKWTVLLRQTANWTSPLDSACPEKNWPTDVETNQEKMKMTLQKQENLVQVQQEYSVYFCIKMIFKSWLLWLIWPFQCQTIIILTMAEFVGNLLEDSAVWCCKHCFSTKQSSWF